MVQVAISLTSPVFRLSDADENKPTLRVTSTLLTPSTITVEVSGEREAGTVLGTSEDPEFRVEVFDFHDVSTAEPVVYELFPGSCEPAHHFLELHASQSRVTEHLLHESDPLADPIYFLKPGHAYRITLRPQTLKCWIGGIDELLARREIVPPAEGEEEVPGLHEYRYPGEEEWRLACDDELILKVEE